MAGKGKRGVRDDARFGAQGTGIIVLPWKEKKKAGVLKEVEFNLGCIEVRVLARN